MVLSSTSKRLRSCHVMVSSLSCAPKSGGGKVHFRIRSRGLLGLANKVIRKLSKDPVLRSKGLVNTIARILIGSPAGKCNVFIRRVATGGVKRGA